MKSFYYLFGLLVMSLVCLISSAQNITINYKSKNDLTKLNLLGNVKYLTEYKIVDKFGELQREKDKTIILFNEYGNFLDIESYDSDGHLHSKLVFKYDDKNNIIGKYNCNLLDNSLEPTCLYKYNDQCKQIEKNLTDRDGIYGKFIYKYDDNGNKFEEYEYKSNGDLLSKTIYTYDNKNNMIENKSFNSQGDLIEDWIYLYDNKGNVLEKSTNLKIISSQNHWGKFYKKYVYKYDDKNNIIQEDRYEIVNNSLSKLTYGFVYDKTGNWIKETDFNEKGFPKFREEREIEYY